MISKEKINEIKQAVNIVDVIGETISLTKAGRNFLGLCPFHGEKTPSFNVVEDKQFFHCFGCGKSGDVFKFIEEYRGISFSDSVQVVAEKAGIELEQQAVVQRERQVHPHQVLFDIHAEAEKFYHALLMTTKMGAEARQYLHQRGLTDEVIKHFQLGLAPQEQNYLYRHLSGKFSEQDLLASGLFNPADNNLIYDAFQGRIMFPLTDEHGRVLAFSGRIWQQKDSENKQIAKYKNSRSTAIFNKSYELYHLDKAKASIKKSREVYLMEGFMDVIAAHRAGIDNAVASMGTALTREHVHHLAKFCKKVILTYDGDAAGQAATAKALEELQAFQVEIISLPENLDPDEFLARNSEELLHQVLTNSRISDVEFLIQYLKPENPDNLQMQIDFVDQIAPIIAKNKSITAQNSYIYKVADVLPDFDYGQVEAAVNHLRVNERQARSQMISSSQPPLTTFGAELPRQARLSRLVRAENHLFYRMVTHLYILNDYRLREDFAFFTPELQVLFELLKEHGEVTAYDLAQQTEQVQRAWYQVLEEKLPEEVGENELEELERRRHQEQLKRENQQKSRVIREQVHVGNTEAALDELAQLIAQKRKME
ncbi:DNA primase [Streptococcus sp. zg-86]|uniref:DNA primase n=1 Tax=Streptococcus zhangguiae TaxID=2664091 RepID=A0A6I4RPL1_9STRE|nr:MULTISPECIES: DNA primase [unclassified Streptococcus]MTB64057.1 DNA primase [Streptococcus sp. zg-86]MTB90367.1 DNA primase [Streptococcus sp. zg-36]MWV56045.1 DNA primase [Streptococcus sp. zg-70]QTH47082.1 DNA primase [Streptococcus sp. zg-86]